LGAIGLNQNLDIERLRQMDAMHSFHVADSVAQSLAYPQSQQEYVPRIKELYLKIFKPELRSVLLTNHGAKRGESASYYYVRITRDKIDYREEEGEAKRQIVYIFDTGKVSSNGNEQDEHFLEKFFLKMRSISGEIEAGKAQVFEEPREG
jgi:hypothetical protein